MQRTESIKMYFTNKAVILGRQLMGILTNKQNKLYGNELHAEDDRLSYKSNLKKSLYLP